MRSMCCTCHQYTVVSVKLTLHWRSRTLIFNAHPSNSKVNISAHKHPNLGILLNFNLRHRLAPRRGTHPFSLLKLLRLCDGYSRRGEAKTSWASAGGKP